MRSGAVKATTYVGAILGVTLFLALLLHADLGAIAHTVALAGWPILWLFPYRLLFFVLYGLAWQALLRPYDMEQRAGLAFLSWGAAVREGIDRLLPVASVGGTLVGVRILGWRGVAAAPAAATVVVEVLCTLVALAAFAFLGLTLLAAAGVRSLPVSPLVLLVLGLGVPLVLGFALRDGSIFTRLEALAGKLVGVRALAGVASSLDTEIRATLGRSARVAASVAWQLCAMGSGAFEVWFALRLFGHPIDLRGALIMESLTQAARHIAFIVPGALGIQELSLVVVGGSLGIGADLALAVSLIKRARELVWGATALASWQWEEGRRLGVVQRQP